MNEQFFEPGGISYRVSDFRAERQTLVFIHGLSGSSSAWFEYEKVFEVKYNILNLDLLGHGKSGKPKEYDAYSVEAHARSVCELLTHIGVGHFVLVSHSFGALIALEVLLRRMEKALGSVFLSPSYAIDTARLGRATRHLVDVAVTAIRWLPFSATIRGRTDYTKYRETGEWNFRRMYADIRNTTVRVYLFCLSQIYRFNQTGKWEQITTRTLIIHGKADNLVPVELAVRMNEVLPNSRLILLDGADHIIVLNNVVEISRTIEKFIESLHHRDSV